MTIVDDDDLVDAAALAVACGIYDKNATGV